MQKHKTGLDVQNSVTFSPYKQMRPWSYCLPVCSTLPGRCSHSRPCRSPATTFGQIYRSSVDRLEILLAKKSPERIGTCSGWQHPKVLIRKNGSNKLERRNHLKSQRRLIKVSWTSFNNNSASHFAFLHIFLSRLVNNIGERTERSNMKNKM